MGREGKRWASLQEPHYAQTTQRRAGIQDRQGLLRPRRPRSASCRHGLALLGAHDGEKKKKRFGRGQRVTRGIPFRGVRSTVIPAQAGIYSLLQPSQTLRTPEFLRLETLSRYVFRSV